MDESWRDDALCAQIDPEAWFPDKGGSVRAAKEVCTQCEVRAICLRWALEHGERFGVWGGYSERERRRMSPRRPFEALPGGGEADRDMKEEAA